LNKSFQDNDYDPQQKLSQHELSKVQILQKRIHQGHMGLISCQKCYFQMLVTFSTD